MKVKHLLLDFFNIKYSLMKTNFFIQFLICAFFLILHQEIKSQTILTPQNPTGSMFATFEKTAIANRMNEVSANGKYIARQCVSVNSSVFSNNNFTVTMPDGRVLTCVVSKRMNDLMGENCLGKIQYVGDELFWG